uniref:Ovule protein n=1 Tax=Acrobeloides nanus TaxID=290746 RepID=A0A914E8Z7_9BILA
MINGAFEHQQPMTLWEQLLIRTFSSKLESNIITTNGELNVMKETRKLSYMEESNENTSFTGESCFPRTSSNACMFLFRRPNSEIEI